MNECDKAPVYISLLTGGSDKPYVIGLTGALQAEGVFLDLIGSDELDCPEVHDRPGVRFLNLRGSQQQDANFLDKVARILRYYLQLLRYAISAKPKLFHILWNNKFEHFDRTFLMLFYKVVGKKVVFTAHNVNAAKRDENDSTLNRITLRTQYRLADCVFVHTQKAKAELVEGFGIPSARVTLIPFGINNAVPHTNLTSAEAKQELRIANDEKTILFFGRITPYKGLEYVIDAVRELSRTNQKYRLVIAGRPDNCESYWNSIRTDLAQDIESGRVLLRSSFIPDNEVEVYFKAADVLALPYKEIYQSGVLFLAHSFGLPVIAADVGSLKDDIVEGQTGFVFRPADATHLAQVIQKYFASDLYRGLIALRPEIQAYAAERHSWDVVGKVTLQVYANLLGLHSVTPTVVREKSTVLSSQRTASAGSMEQE